MAKKEDTKKTVEEVVKEVKAETGWRDIFKIVEEAQKRLKEGN